MGAPCKKAKGAQFIKNREVPFTKKGKEKKRKQKKRRKEKEVGAQEAEGRAKWPLASLT